MAKLKAPLLSLGASGQLAKALVFFPWKGLNVVREYVVPANPKTTLQTTQRGYLTAVVAAVHAAQAHATPLNSDDQIAYSAYTQIKGKPWTWFNAVVRICLLAILAGDGKVVYRAGAMSDTDKDDFRPWLGFTDDGVTMLAAGKFYLGTSKTNLNQVSGAATVVANVSLALAALAGFDGLVAGTKYYWQFRPDVADPCEEAVSGIYHAYAT